MNGLWFKGLWLVLLAACGLALYDGMSQLEKVRSELDQVLAENQQLDKSNRALYRRVSRLRGDREEVSRAVRYEMGLIRPDEVVYQVQPSPPAKTGRQAK